MLKTVHGRLKKELFCFTYSYSFAKLKNLNNFILFKHFVTKNKPFFLNEQAPEACNLIGTCVSFQIAPRSLLKQPSKMAASYAKTPTSGPSAETSGPSTEASDRDGNGNQTDKEKMRETYFTEEIIIPEDGDVS